jgi:hypothetical protein
LAEHVGAYQKCDHATRVHLEENQMTAIADTTPGHLIRWHYLGYAVLALGVMTVAIASHDHWFLNFVHVICGVLWTGIDLFMGFVIGPILRKVGLSVRREIIVRLVPRTLFLMPTLSIITGTTGWFLAKDLGLLALAAVRLGRGGAHSGGSDDDPGHRLPAADQLVGLHPVAPARSRPCQDQPGDAQFLFCRRRAGNDAGPDHCHHGPFRDWPVSPAAAAASS